ncbi:MAG: tetratricopeptide repeat protein [Myxococcota bacterium]|nr:tetratricopeptide repeat protein [Myxococcota bacterium]
MAQSLHYSERAPEAIAAARRSLEIYERVCGPEHPRVGAVLGNLAILHSLSERYDEAIALFDRARRITEARDGAEHADNGTNWLNIASTRKAAGQLDAAATGYLRAIEIGEHALGKDHVELARPLVGLADVELQRRAPERALPLLERGLALRTANAANPSTLAHTRFLLAKALRALRRDPARVAALAKQARDAYAAAEDADEGAAIDAWLKTSGRAAP